MKIQTLLLITILLLPMLVWSQPSTMVSTTGDYSPAVIARDFNAAFGVRADVVRAVLDVYARKGLSVQDRKAKTEDLIRSYSTGAAKSKGVLALSPEERKRMRIESEPDLVQALNWDLFAKQHYLSTAGAYSPAIVAKGDVNIWFGIPEGALRTLAGRLEANEVELAEFEKRLSELAEKYAALKTEFEVYGPSDPVVREAEKLLDAGRLEEAEALLESDYHASKKRLAYKAYLYGKTKELLLKYEEAAEGYRDAVELDSGNVEYLIAHGRIEKELTHYDTAKTIFQHTLLFTKRRSNVSDDTKAEILEYLGTILAETAQIDEAMVHFETALHLYSGVLESNNPKVSRQYRNLGAAFGMKGNYRRGIELVSTALQLDTLRYPRDSISIAEDLRALGVMYMHLDELDSATFLMEHSINIKKSIYDTMHPSLAPSFADLGVVMFHKGDYSLAISYLEEALKIDTLLCGAFHRDSGNMLGILGQCWSQKGDHKKAISYYNRALSIDTMMYGRIHPSVAIHFSNIGVEMFGIGQYEDALFSHTKALEIHTRLFGQMHPNVASDLGNMGITYSHLGNLEVAIDFMTRSREISELIFGRGHTMVATQINNIGGVWDRMGNPKNALTCFEESLEIYKGLLGEYHPDLCAPLVNIARISNKMGYLERARNCIQIAIKIDSTTFGANHPRYARDLVYLGNNAALTGKHTSALELYKKALEIYQHSFGNFHPKIADLYDDLGMSLEALNQHDDAIYYLQKSFEVNAVYHGITHVHSQKIIDHLAQVALSASNELQRDSLESAKNYHTIAFRYASLLIDNRNSLTYLQKIASRQIKLEDYMAALATLVKATHLADSIATSYLETEISLPDSIRFTEKYLTERDSILLGPITRQLHYQKITCLAALDRKKETKALAKELIPEVIAAKDEELLQLLKKDGWIKD